MHKPAISVEALSLSLTNSEGFLVTISLGTTNTQASGSVLPRQWFFKWLCWEYMSAHPHSWLILECLTFVEKRMPIGNRAKWLRKHIWCTWATAGHRKRSPWTQHILSHFLCICDDKSLGWTMPNDLRTRMWLSIEFCWVSGHRSRVIFQAIPIRITARGFWSEVESPWLKSPLLVHCACRPCNAFPVLSLLHLKCHPPLLSRVRFFYLVMWLAL